MIQDVATKTIATVLNKQVANWSVLYVKLHNFHWYVKGKHFYELHTKFEEFYTEAAAYVDELAERLLAIGGKPIGSMKEYLSEASISEATGNESTEQMVRSINNDFRMLVSDLHQGIHIAESEDDHATADMLTHIRTNIEKHSWMLESFLVRD
ncbi:Dps family protein [Mechercharimyces sp. CAU 1602]|uniref:Dps family protein n=1 Tax=Mechercharimyces sp. CAU 1602 TaxID=2973933 RepID=UPI0021628750|nr:Dps family protein [Mechercharimyces sp. CAU 1602]MCS1351196.1 DNA starvation/stationary phase protection protein [Mechercharimyces sp. CAU 1602]